MSMVIRPERYNKVRSGISRQSLLSEMSGVCEDWCADKNSCMSELEARSNPNPTSEMGDVNWYQKDDVNDFIYVTSVGDDEGDG